MDEVARNMALIKAIRDQSVANKRSSELLSDWFDILRATYDHVKLWGDKYAAEKKQMLVSLHELRGITAGNVERGFVPAASHDVLKKTYFLTAKENFEDYMIALEWERQAKDRFYLPRQKTLRPVVVQLQKMIDGELDELFFSMPARVGKTTLLMFLQTFLIGKEPEVSNLYCAYSDGVVKTLFKGTLEVITDPITYGWSDIFPMHHIEGTDADQYLININRRKRYASLTCRSLYGTLNGACDCNGFLIADDLVSGIEEALSKDRLIAVNAKVANNMLPRAKENAKIVWMGTRWSMIDPIGVRLEMLHNDPMFKDRKFAEINLPALDANDESNFDYQYGVGFSTDYYRRTRAAFERNSDMASWMSQYQGEPIERSGAVFDPEYMKFYNGELPDGEPDRIIAACDPAWGGIDAVSCPIAYLYGDDVYVHDVVYSFDDKTVTQPEIERKFLQHKVQAAQFEANKTTAAYKESIEQNLKAKGYRLNITTKAASSQKSKADRIQDKRPEIYDFYFLEEGKRTKEYSLFMQNVYSYRIMGKNKHEDAPDSLAMLADMIRGRQYGTVEILKRKYF